MGKLRKLVGRTIKKIYMNEEFLKFETDEGNFVFTVEGDCCSHSVFYDFYGVAELLKGNKVTEVKEVQLTTDDRMDAKNYNESISVYGFQIFTDGEEWGERTSVFSFRNYSNGYYGGWMEETSDRDVAPEITKDVIMTD